MQIFLPNSAYLMNLEGFLKRCVFERPEDLEVRFHQRWISVHPAVIALLGCLGTAVREASGKVATVIPNDRIASLRYLHRMGLFKFLQCDSPVQIEEHEATGRFIPLTQVTSPDNITEFLTEVIPLLHVKPEEALPIRYVLSELIRNVLEHSQSPHGAFVCAQYYKGSKKLALGVADSGIGIRKALAQSHTSKDDLEAIMLALRPGITGTTKRIGGTDYNAGAGLFFTKSIACASKTQMVVYSGTALFKLRRTPQKDAVILIRADPTGDYKTIVEHLPQFTGTLVGIDIGLDVASGFNELLDKIRKAYHVDVRDKRKQYYKYKARFV